MMEIIIAILGGLTVGLIVWTILTLSNIQKGINFLMVYLQEQNEEKKR